MHDRARSPLRVPAGVIAGLLFLSTSLMGGQPTGEPVLAIVGATIIDGNGGPPLRDATLVVRGRTIEAVGARGAITVPAGARTIDGAGKFVTPGFVDTNVHLGPLSSRETFARYWDRLDQVVLQAAQMQLKYGVTAVRDSYGPLPPLLAVRDRIARGQVVGPRMYVAGNIVGWGGPFSDTFSRTPESGLDLFQEQMNDLFTQGTGEELMHMTPAELRVAMNAYLDKGVDFVKYGGTWHINYPTLISFSPRAQKVIVEETQKRGLIAETHSTTLEGLHMSIMAGVDLIQHPEVVGERLITDELLDLIVERKIICSMLPNKYTGKVWQERLKKTQEKTAGTAAGGTTSAAKPERLTPRTAAELHREQDQSGIPAKGSLLVPNLEMRQANGRKLIQRGAIISVGADNVVGEAPEFRRTLKEEHMDPGLGTIIAIEGLVELGMSPAQAIVAATKNGALACKGLERFGTLEKGKLADVVILGADPLVSISNIRKVEMVLKEGAVVDLKSLPTVRPFGEWAATKP